MKPKRKCIPERVMQAVLRRDGMTCRRCFEPVRFRQGPRGLAPDALEFGHLIPVSQGGENTTRNLVVMCQRCNRSLGARPFIPAARCG